MNILSSDQINNKKKHTKSKENNAKTTNTPNYPGMTVKEAKPYYQQQTDNSVTSRYRK
ncbi:MAG TPA: hypothetical protein VMY77_04020 [Chitinophagaceae bacterium]|nr:hypothetical protein [Chitinophagaceae bacterium]